MDGIDLQSLVSDHMEMPGNAAGAGGSAGAEEIYFLVY